MSDAEKEVEEIKQDAEVRRALQQATASEAAAKPMAKTRDKLLFGTHVLLLLVLGAFYYLLGLRFFSFAGNYLDPLRKLTVAGAIIVLFLVVLKLFDVYLIGRVPNAVYRHNLRRVLRLVAWLVLAFILLTLLFQNWYTAVVSFGLISLILGFALQTPITSFIGWIYILVREPYRVGDRIRIGNASGDVIDVSYLDTTLWEFGGEYPATDHPGGRVIKFPNSNVLSTPVFNYTWPLFPYVWSEIKFQIAYDSDLEFVATTMQEVTEREVGDAMMKHVRIFSELLAQTHVHQFQVPDKPVVTFRVGDNTWLEVVVKYLVSPREAGRVRTKLIKELLARLNEEPTKVLFPKGDSR